MESPVRVFVVDDNALLRLGLSETVNMEPGLELIGTASNTDDALVQIRELKPDVITMDYQMPGGNGVDCTRQIVSEFPNAKVILLSVFDSEEDIWNAVQAGVKGYLTKKAGEIEDVMEAIHEVARGGTYFPSGLAQKLERRRSQKGLTDREMEVLKLLASGLSNKEIGSELDLSVAMVKLHIINLREKLDAVDRTQAVVQAFKRGILHLEDQE